MTFELKPVYDRSRVVQDWKCERSRYLQYEYDGTGIVRSSTSLELFMGITLHDALATIATLTQKGQQIDIDELASLTNKQMVLGLTKENPTPEAEEFAKEQACLVEGLIRGFYKHAWPRILAQYPKILFAETEMEYEHDGLRFLSKPDLILSTEDESEVVYIEYKSTSSKRDAWVNSWDTAIQLHSTVAAVKATTGINVDAVIVQGLYKGYESYGKQSSPFCYAYKRLGNPPFSKDEISYDYRPGFKRSPVWELPGGVKKWVDDMPEIVLADQFPCTAPIYLKEEMVSLFFKQRATREHEIAATMNYILSPTAEEEGIKARLNDVFPQRFDQCVPSFGRECAYKRICHGYVPDPYAEGFVPRDPHHDPEVIYLKARKEAQ